MADSPVRIVQLSEGHRPGRSQGFKAVARVFPAPDVAALPIGGPAPRRFLEKGHMPPVQAVKAFRIPKIRTFLAVGHGTFDTSEEPLDEGNRRLIAAADGVDMDLAMFHLVEHGATLSCAD